MNRLCHIYKNVNVILSSQAARGAFMSTEVSGTTAAIATSTPGRPRPISDRTGLLCFLPGRETGKGMASTLLELWASGGPLRLDCVDISEDVPCVE